MGRFDDQVVLITGASRGIGAETARLFHREGATVIINVARSVDAADALALELGERATVARADVRDPEAVTTMIKTVVKDHGRLDVLVNNAGITRDGLVAAMTDDEWDDVMSVNAGGAFRAVRAACRPMMMARRGRIINVSSVAARAGGRGQANYAASKAALEGFTRSLAAELAPRGITVNAVAPGVIVTEMTELVREQAGEQILARIPLGRYGTTTEVAEAILFLASDEASYITGATLAVDGGF